MNHGRFKRIRIQPLSGSGSSLYADRQDPAFCGSGLRWIRIRFSPGSQSAYVTCRLDVQVVVLHVLDVLEGGLHLLLHLFILLLGG
jgi:hypothetical protein